MFNIFGRIQRLIIGGLGLAICFLIAKDLTASNWALQSDGFLIAFIVILAFITAVTKKAWPGAIILVGCVAVTVPVGVFSKILPAQYFTGMVALFITLEAVTRSELPFPKMTKPGGLLLLVLLAITARVIYERPGATTYGSESGGATFALLYFIAFGGFLASSKVLEEAEHPMASVKMVLTLAWPLFLVEMVPQALASGGWVLFVQKLYTPLGWLFCAFLLAWAYHRRATSGDALAAWFPLTVWATALPILLSVLTPHRSRLWFALATILAVGYAYRTRFTAPWFVSGALVAILLVVGNLAPNAIPKIMQRSLSTLAVPSGRAGPEADETGWTSPWRSKLYTMAVDKIRTHPFIGSGIKYTVYDLQADSRRGYAHLINIGSWHNSAFTLAVSFGLPLAILFIGAAILLGTRFVRTLRWAPLSEEKCLMAGVLGYSVTRVGQALMNGGVHDIMIVSMLLGVMNGYIVRATKAGGDAGGSVPAQAPESLPATRFGDNGNRSRP